MNKVHEFPDHPPDTTSHGKPVPFSRKLGGNLGFVFSAGGYGSHKFLYDEKTPFLFKIFNHNRILGCFGSGV